MHNVIYFISMFSYLGLLSFLAGFLHDLKAGAIAELAFFFFFKVALYHACAVTLPAISAKGFSGLSVHLHPPSLPPVNQVPVGPFHSQEKLRVVPNHPLACSSVQFFSCREHIFS